MKAGDVLNGYTILEDFKVVGCRSEQVDVRRARRTAVLHQGVPEPDLSRRLRAG